MENRTITTDAIGRQEATPELATIEAVVVGEGGTAASARTTARDRAATLRETVTTVATDQIQTVEIQVEDTDEMFEPTTDARYQATEHVHVECVPETAADVVVEVTDAGGSIRSVEFGLHETRYREFQNEALAAAMERAREKADRIAAAEGVAVSEVVDVTTQQVDTGMGSIVDEALAAGSDTDLQPTPIEIVQRVEVVYEIAGT